MITIATPIYGSGEPPGIIEDGGLTINFPARQIPSPNINAGDLLWIISYGINPSVDGTWSKPAIMNFSGGYNVHVKVADGDATDIASTNNINQPQLFHIFFRCTKPGYVGNWGAIPAASSTSISGNITTFPIQGLGSLGSGNDRIVTIGIGQRNVASGSGPSFSYPSYVGATFTPSVLEATQNGTTWYYSSTFHRVVDGTAPVTASDAWGGASAGVTGATFSRMHHFRYS